MLYAHTPGPGGAWHSLGEHLRAVSDLAATNAAPFAGSELARWAGLWHDVGKASQAFQDYLLACHREPGRRHSTVDHKGAGAVLTLGVCDELAFLIQGHHGGLPDRADLGTTLKERRVDPRMAEAWQRAQKAGLIPPEPPPRTALPFPPFVQDRVGQEFFLRMLFSALVDADHLDTERHMDPERAGHRGATPDLSTLAARLEAAQTEFAGRGDDPVSAVRREVYAACLAAATEPPGLFRLTVPTGGGKTRSGLAFALRHAVAHGLRRVIVAVPYLTITDQTAAIFRRVLGDDRAVLEHYSGAGASDDASGAATPLATWRRLAAQDWDAPVVVTTTVQLFESLFARSPSACRKLHRIAGSVLVLDEAQALPAPLLGPILDVLRRLVADYGVSAVLCTATQPEFAAVPGFSDLAGVREIAPDPPRLFRVLERVTYEWPRPGETWDWDRVAAQLRAVPQGLAVVNTKADALALLDALNDPDAFHLSTLLCGAHRRDVLARVRARLAAGEPCRVVSTQVVEAGVDLDFPLVLRALGPLDRIVQAAGRCNREGRLARGRVVVFAPAGGGLPPGAYRTATQVTCGLLAGGPPDLGDPAVFAAYFRGLFPVLDLDAKGIQKLRDGLAFETVAREFRMIEEDTASIFVPYTGMPNSSITVDDGEAGPEIDHAARSAVLLQELRAVAAGKVVGGGRRLLARTQPYLVSVRRNRLQVYEADGLVTPLVGDIWAWEGQYDDVRGLVGEGRDAAEFVI